MTTTAKGYRGIENVACECCGLTYDRFRTGVTYAEAYHWIAWNREHTSRRAVLRAMGSHKRDMWALHLEECGRAVDTVEAGEESWLDFVDGDEGLDASFDFGFNAEPVEAPETVEAVEAVEVAPVAAPVLALAPVLAAALARPEALAPVALAAAPAAPLALLAAALRTARGPPQGGTRQRARRGPRPLRGNAREKTTGPCSFFSTPVYPRATYSP